MGNHLSEDQLALYVDALVSDTQDQLPEHVEECEECKMEVIGVRELIEGIGPHQVLDNPSK
jgi:hypothetical protein